MDSPDDSLSFDMSYVGSRVGGSCTNTNLSQTFLCVKNLFEVYYEFLC